jgi:hypothetical protein
MVAAEEFIKYCSQTLEVNFGDLSNEILNKIRLKKNLNDKSNASDMKEFIDLIEVNVALFSGKHKAKEISNILRNKANEAAQVPLPKPAEFQINADIDKEINLFLSNSSLPTEADITDYTKYLTMKYGGNTKSLEKGLIDKVKLHVKVGIGRMMLKSEIYKFLARYKQPNKNDMDDFVNYINFLKLGISETEVREQFEKERLYRKFHEPQEIGSSELDQFISVVKTSNDKDAIAKLMQKQGLSYLIKDETGVSDQSLSEFVELMSPNENDMKDALEGMGLKHLIVKK